jgi:hypothetical protein
MPVVTLILTRYPLEEFLWMSSNEYLETETLNEAEKAALYEVKRSHHKVGHVTHLSGRWGSLAVVTGPRITKAAFASFSSPLARLPLVGAPLGTAHMLGQVAGLVAGTLAGATTQTVALAGRLLELTTDGSGPITAVKEYTSMERYRSDKGQLGGHGYVMLHPQATPYGLTVEHGNSVVKTLRTGHSGNCLRVHGGKAGPEQGILIHEAPTIDYLIGCISPRPKGHKTPMQNKPGNPSAVAMQEIFDGIGKSTQPRKSSLFVMDW